MVKFGIYLPQVNVDYNAVKRVTLECERQGFDSAWMSDHLLQPLQPQGPFQDSNLECWTTLSSLAAVTTKLRLGTLVLCNLFRYPSVLAKMAATLDVISNGRLELGIGAGWFKPEFISYGIPFSPKASIRIAQLQEALTIIKKMWTEEKATFQGQYYRMQEAFCNPKPVQKPHPPIWVGTMIGKKRMFETIAKYADGWAISSLYLPKPEDYRRQIEELQTYCQQAGRSVENIEKALGVGCIVAENQRELEEKTLRFSPAKISVERYVATQPRLEGTPDQCVERLKDYVDVGVTHFVMNFPDVTTLEPLRLFGEHVIPAFKQN